MVRHHVGVEELVGQQRPRHLQVSPLQPTTAIHGPEITGVRALAATTSERDHGVSLFRDPEATVAHSLRSTETGKCNLRSACTYKACTTCVRHGHANCGAARCGQVELEAWAWPSCLKNKRDNRTACRTVNHNASTGVLLHTPLKDRKTVLYKMRRSQIEI